MSKGTIGNTLTFFVRNTKVRNKSKHFIEIINYKYSADFLKSINQI